MSGLARTRQEQAYSEFYKLNMESGRFLNFRYNSEFQFEDVEYDFNGAITELAKYMSIVDRWIKEERVKNIIPALDFDKSKQTIHLALECQPENASQDVKRNPRSNNGPFGEKSSSVLSEFTIELSLMHAIDDDSKNKLQMSLCGWMESHKEVTLVVHIDTLKYNSLKENYGIYDGMSVNVRTDLKPLWQNKLDIQFEKIKTTIHNTVDSMIKKYQVVFVPFTPENHTMKGKLIRYSSIEHLFSFESLIQEDEEEFADLLSDAFQYELETIKGDSLLSSNTETDLSDFLKRIKSDPYISSAKRKTMREIITKVQDTLRRKYGKYGIEMEFEDMTAQWAGWDTTKRYYANLPLLERLISEADQNGKIMQNNKVKWVKFRTDPWEDDPKHTRLSINVHARTMKEEHSCVIDIHTNEFSGKQHEFYEAFL